VLLIDLDPQAHSSLAFGVKSEDILRSLYDVLDQGAADPPELGEVRIALSENLHIVPAEIVLSAVEQQLVGVEGRERKLLEKIATLDGEYDFIVMDCPPNLGLLTINALRACGELIIPVECSMFSLHGLTQILETVRMLEDATGATIEVKAVLNDFDSRTRFARKIQQELTELFPSRLFRTVIHHSVKLREAASRGKAITEFDRHSAVFQDFLGLSAELIGGLTLKEQNQSEVPVTALDMPAVDPPGTDGRSVIMSIKAPEARSVQIAGEFNNWVPEELLPPIKDGGVWRKLYHLKNGNYRYKFIVDGEWMTDPENPRFEANPYGGADSVLEISAEEVFNGRR
jgi:chromosome partitioning protein